MESISLSVSLRKGTNSQRTQLASGKGVVYQYFATEAVDVNFRKKDSSAYISELSGCQYISISLNGCWVNSVMLLLFLLMEFRDCAAPSFGNVSAKLGPSADTSTSNFLCYYYAINSSCLMSMELNSPVCAVQQLQLQ